MVRFDTKITLSPLALCFYGLAMLPAKAQDLLALWLSRLLAFALRRDNALIRYNSDKVYGLAPQSSFSLLFRRQVFYSQIVILLETLQLVLRRSKSWSIRGKEDFAAEVHRLLAKDKGLIVVTAHLGSWENVAALTAEVSNQAFYALAKRGRSPSLTRFLEQIRARLATEVLWTDRKSLLRDMIKVLKEKGCLGFVMDQKPEGRVGPEVDFFGFKTAFVSGPARLAIKHDTPILAVYCTRVARRSYQVFCESIRELGDSRDETELSSALAKSLELAIRQYPEQWVWNYKRWPMTAADWQKYSI